MQFSPIQVLIIVLHIIQLYGLNISAHGHRMPPFHGTLTLTGHANFIRAVGLWLFGGKFLLALTAEITGNKDELVTATLAYTHGVIAAL